MWNPENRCTALKKITLKQQNDWKLIPLAFNAPKPINNIRLICRHIKKINNAKCYPDFLKCMFKLI